MKPAQIVAIYLICQAAGTAAWWLMLLLFPDTIDWFKPAAWPNQALLGFWLGDFTLLIGGSLATAIGVLRRRVWASVAIWSLAAAVWYPTLYCIGVSLMTGEAWIASGMMVGMAGLTLAMATILGTTTQVPATIRETEMSKNAAIGWTFAQVILFWSVFLWIIPMAITELEQRIGWSSFSAPWQTGTALTVFTAASMMGFWSGVAMASAGQGTPLPTATAPQLVTSGPYRFVRNPMAVAGILQGISVGWLLGSYTVIAYAIVGAFVWHVFVRPVEEHDLQARLGESYRQYQKDVGLWIPSIRWRVPGNTDRG